MSVLTSIASAAVSGFWKVGAIVALALAVGAGGGWALAAHDRDANLALFAAERQANDALRASLREQNRAVDALADQKRLADERRAAAEHLAAANGRRFDRALEQAAGARATTCGDAMPTVNKILEAVR
jgi:hypothetical protein